MSSCSGRASSVGREPQADGTSSKADVNGAAKIAQSQGETSDLLTRSQVELTGIEHAARAPGLCSPQSLRDARANVSRSAPRAFCRCRVGWQEPCPVIPSSKQALVCRTWTTLQCVRINVNVNANVKSWGRSRWTSPPLLRTVEPLGLYFRPGRNDHTAMLQALAIEGPDFTGAVLDASLAARQEV